MAIPTKGKYYSFSSVYAPTQRINLYITGGKIANEQNVCAYAANEIAEQHWYYDGNYLLSKVDTSFCLDRMNYQGKSYHNNAEIYKTTGSQYKNQEIEFQDKGDCVRIKLRNLDLYLTIVDKENGNSTGTSSTSSGNLYWAELHSNGNKQKWTFKEVGSSGGGSSTAPPDVLPKTGKTYRIESAAAGYCLDAMGTIQSGANIGLWGSNGGANQKWLLESGLLKSDANTNFRMSRYSSTNNCELSASGAQVEFIQNNSGYGNHVAVRLKGYELYLTCNANGGGSASGKTTTSTGNVYWASWGDGLNQRWTFKEVASSGNSGSGGGTITTPPDVLPKTGKTYRVDSAAAGYCLDAMGSIQSGANIGLWGSNGGANQKWLLDSGMLKSDADTNFRMSRSSTNNCELSASGAQVEFIQNNSGYGNHVAVRLKGYELYLTCNANGAGSATGKSTTSTGNVYWAAWDDGLDQRWTFKEVASSGNSGSGGGTGTGEKIVTNCPGLVTTRTFHPSLGGWVNGTWSQNNGASLETKLYNFYKKIYGFAPANYSRYTNFLYGEKQNASEYHVGHDFNNGEKVIGVDTIIYAGQTGRVIIANENEGKVAIYDGNRTFYYLHFDHVFVDLQQNVTAGVTPIGVEGMKGNATGYHVHLEVLDGENYSGPRALPNINQTGSTLNPYLYI